MAFPFAALGAGLGQFAESYQQQQNQRIRNTLLLRQQQLREQELRREQQAADIAYGALGSDIFGTGGLGLPGATPGSGAGLIAGPLSGNFLPTTPGSGMESGLRRATRSGLDTPGLATVAASAPPPSPSGRFSAGIDTLISQGILPDVAMGFISYMRLNESGGNPLALNPVSGAFGRAQWLGPRKSSLVNEFGPRPTDVQQAQFMSRELAGPEQATMNALRAAKTWKEGYDIAGRMYERPGAAALGRAGVGSPAALNVGYATGPADALNKAEQQSATISDNTRQNIDPLVYGRMAAGALKLAIDKAAPNADPLAKMMAFDRLYKILAPGERMQWEMYKQQNQQQFALLRQQILAGQRNWSIQQLPPEKGGGLVRVNPNTGEVQPIDLPSGTTRQGTPGQQLLPEMRVPDKWPGMPEQPPPGVRNDVWTATLLYARTGHMPPLGFQAGLRNQIIQALPAAAHALGLPPTQLADLQAQFAGERHGMIIAGGRAAQIALGIEEAKKAAPQVVSTSKSVPRSQFPSANQFTNWLQLHTGDPNIVAFREALNTYLNIYAATVSRTGRLTDAQQQHAYELLSVAFTEGQIERGIQQLDYEMELMREAVAPAMEQITPLGQPPAIRPPQTQAAPPQIPPAGGGGGGRRLRFDENGNQVQ